MTELPDGVDRRAVADLMADLLIDHARAREASGWVVLVLDCEKDPPKPISVYGPFEQPEQALAQAGRWDADPETGAHPVDGEPGWNHVVLPLFEEPKA